VKAYVFPRPGYQTVADFSEAHQKHKWQLEANDWLHHCTKALQPLSDAYKHLAVLRDVFESDEALDAFLYEFFYAKPQYRYADGDKPVGIIALTGRAKEFAPYLRTLTVDAALEVYRVTVNNYGWNEKDMAVLFLFALCFEGGAEALGGWYGVDDFDDLFRVAECVQAGAKGQLLIRAIEDDIDVSLIGSILGE
jgi:hypothetical protein